MSASGQASPARWPIPNTIRTTPSDPRTTSDSRLKPIARANSIMREREKDMILVCSSPPPTSISNVPGLARFRVNAYHQDRGTGAAFRVIPNEIWTLEDLQAPTVFRDIIDVPRGLILVTGPTGSGKSTTLAALVDHLNKNVAGHILTIEDPIEFVHNSKKCLINQREVKKDTLSFNAALRSALREDPDIILVGELRDTETVRLALTAAETGHVVFGTLHTSSAAKTIDRVIDVFPGEEKEMVRSMLSESLRAVVADGRRRDHDLVGTRLPRCIR